MNKNPVHKFKKGNKANPLGAAAHNPIMRKVKRLTNEEIENVGTLLLETNEAELQKISDDPTSNALKSMIAGVALKAIQNQDAYCMEVILNRLAGKPKEKLEVEARVENKTAVVYVAQWGGTAEPTDGNAYNDTEEDT